MDVSRNMTFTNVTPTPAPAPPPEPPSCYNMSSIPGVISNETFQGLAAFSERYSAIHGYMSTAVCLFGLMSNSANIIVLTRRNMITSTNTILMWLAVADLLTMMSYLPFAIHFYIMKEPDLEVFQTRSFGWIIFLMFHANFSIVCHTVAIWLTIALAIFRYIYICMPTKGSFYCSLRRAKMTIFTVYVLTVVVCMPNYFTNRIYTDVKEVKRPTPGNANGSGVGVTGAGEVEGEVRPEAEKTTIYSPIQWQNSQAAEITSQVGRLWVCGCVRVFVDGYAGQWVCAGRRVYRSVGVRELWVYL